MNILSSCTDPEVVFQTCLNQNLVQTHTLTHTQQQQQQQQL